ncbi:PEGA domain-containing protein [Methanogenium organophilum]|uniref:PEGA domain-containing protein n=1 Tax=Methanogenium organophilum TaxID=2199 RepID=A0A9X9T8A3_METOG|nr:PEGA domain-containing protein [Methanogenium organophilum]WAI02228.1 PEGA domain-containing protein [Methanogenium organophilum]
MTENASDSETNRTGKIIVNSIPDGVSVKLDGKDTGKTPATLENITAGFHKVEVNLPDNRQISRNISVSAGNTSTICLNKYTEKEVNIIKAIGIYIALTSIMCTAPGPPRSG